MKFILSFYLNFFFTFHNLWHHVMQNLNWIAFVKYIHIPHSEQIDHSVSLLQDAERILRLNPVPLL
jgi:hypothetical protein